MSASAVPIHVSPHAVWRAYERFPGFDPCEIEPEIREAFRRGRVSKYKPEGVFTATDPKSLYAWTPSGFRIYVIRLHTDGSSLTVVTTLQSMLDPTWVQGDKLVVEQLPPPTPGYWGKR